MGNLKAPSDIFFEIIRAGFQIYNKIIKPTLHEIHPHQRFCDYYIQWLRENKPLWMKTIENTPCEHHFYFIIENLGRMLLYYN